MSWKLSIRHQTGYHYQGEVRESYNEARVTPLSTDRQLALEASVKTSPAVTTYRYWDYWSTLVDAFDIHVPHTEMTVVGESVVETSPAPDPGPSIEWSRLAEPDLRHSFFELLAPTEYAPRFEEAAEAARTIRSAGSPVDAAASACAWVRDRLAYEKGTTHVFTTAPDAVRIGSGVCQDFAHLALSVLRAMGIPSRYVSGYLHPRHSAGVGETVVGQSHAWVEVWTGEWWPLDPTHGSPVGERHVIVARGRDYADVPPLKGLYHGAPSKGLSVTVALTRLD